MDFLYKISGIGRGGLKAWLRGEKYLLSPCLSISSLEVESSLWLCSRAAWAASRLIL
jgi:hypothetical protein